MVMTLQTDPRPVEASGPVVPTEAELEWEHYVMAGQAHRDLVTRLQEGLKLLFAGRDDRLVLGEVTTYYDGGSMIPDVSVVHGLPQADYPSYAIGRDGPAPAVVIEVVSPNDTDAGNHAKLLERFGAGATEVWLIYLLTASVSRFVATAGGYAAAPGGPCEALEGVVFDTSGGSVEPRFADGRSFPADASAERAEAEAAKAEAETAKAEVQRLRELLASHGVTLPDPS